MPLRTLLYLGLFIVAFFGSIFAHPIIGVYAYLATYNINPLGQWWGAYLPGFAQRYAMLLALAIGLGVLFQHSKLRYGRLLERQEVLLILFVGLMWLSVIIGQGAGVHFNVEKMTKVLIVLLMASHIITTRKFFEGMVWVFIISGLYLGYEMYGGAGTTRGGRFDAGVGGSDFGEGNFLAAHFAFILPFIGVVLARSNWKVRLFTLIPAVFIVNAIVITRSRGAFLALAVACVAAFLLSTRVKQHRKKIVALIIVGIIGAVSLTDDRFWERMGTIGVEEEFGERDLSAQHRLDAWHGAWLMVQDYPLGVGVGNFFGHIGDYYPHLRGRDTHNTYLRCLAELGFHGFFVLAMLIASAFFMLWKIERRAESLEPDPQSFFHLYAFALKLSLISYLVAAMFISSVYIEEFYWLLMMPVFLKRALDNEINDAGIEKKISQIM